MDTAEGINRNGRSPTPTKKDDQTTGDRWKAYWGEEKPLKKLKTSVEDYTFLEAIDFMIKNKTTEHYFKKYVT